MDDHKAQLIVYIQEQIRAGHAPEVLYRTLIEAGWDSEMVNEAFSQVYSVQAQPAPVQQQQQVQQQPPVQQYTAPVSQPEYQTSQNQQYQETSQAQAPQKYKVFRSISDTIQAVRNNAAAYFISGIISLIAAGAVLGIVYLALFATVLTKMGGLGTGGGSFLVTLSVIALVTYLSFAISVTLMQIVNAKSLSDGADGKKSQVMALLKNSLPIIPRVIITNLFVGLLATGPLIAITILQLALAFGSRGPSPFLLITSLILSLVAVAWVLLALIRYSLSPFVAIFEPDVSIIKIPKRSGHLLQHGGQWFIVKGSFIVILIVLIMAALTGQSLDELQRSTNIGLNIIFLVIEMIINGSLVMLYRNRKIVRG